MTWLRGHWQLLALTAVVAALWATPVMLPLKILVVFFHELAHGLAAVFTGGEIVSLTVNVQEGGLAVTRGGSRFWVLTAGYLGSLLIGVALLLGALRSRADRMLLAALGAVLVGVTALYMRERFALAFGFGLGTALLGLAWVLTRTGCDLVLRVIGLASLIYVPRDIISDTIARPHLRSDAAMLGELTGLPTQVWGGIWLILSVAIIWFCLRHGLGDHSNVFDRPRAGRRKP